MLLLGAACAPSAPAPTSAPTVEAVATTPPAAAAPPSPVATSPPPVAASPTPGQAVASPTLPVPQASPSPSPVARAPAPAPTVAPSPPAKPAAGSCGPDAIPSAQAGEAVGREATVAIARVEGSYRADLRGQPTFLNDAPFPRHSFTAVIWGENRGAFQPPPESYHGRPACVTGTVSMFQGKPQIEVSSPTQIRAPE